MDQPGADVERRAEDWGLGAWDGEEGGGVTYRHGLEPMGTVGVWTSQVWMLTGMGGPGVWKARDVEDNEGVTDGDRQDGLWGRV